MGNQDGRKATSFQGYRKDCRVCPLKAQCSRKPDQKDGRQVTYFDKSERKACSYMDRMTRLPEAIWCGARRVSLRDEVNKEKIDSLIGRHIYSQQLGTVKPVFGNLEANKGLKRFTLRGKVKVKAQWIMFCMVHNIEKIANQGQ
jgi:hypothetical protein